MVSIDYSNRAAAYIGDTLTAGGGTTVPAYYALVAQAHMAGLGPSDMDFAQLYDCFTPTVLIELEDLGFCAKGEGGSFAASGALAPGGQTPSRHPWWHVIPLPLRQPRIHVGPHRIGMAAAPTTVRALPPISVLSTQFVQSLRAHAFRLTKGQWKRAYRKFHSGPTRDIRRVLHA